MRKQIFALLFLFAFALRGAAQSTPAPEPIISAPPLTIACVGDSITFGYGVGDGARYPQVLNALIGPGYRVLNFGSNGATLLKNGDQPYWTRKEYADAMASNPDIVVIMLGTNDGRPANFEAHSTELAPDLLAMAAQFAALPSHPRVLVAPPVAAFAEGGFGIVPETIQNKIVPLIQSAASGTKLQLIETNEPLQGRKEFYVDNIHPGDKGAAVIASTVARAILQRAAGSTVEIIPATARQTLASGLTGDDNVDARDYEWPAHIPTLTIDGGKNGAAMLRLRRDGGKLCIFAEVTDDTPLPGASTPFAKSDGVEIMLSDIAGKNASRVFLSASRDAAGVLSGSAILAGKTATKMSDAKIAARERFDKRGYFLEAEIPLALFPSLTRMLPNGQRDLLPLRFNAALWRGNGSTPAQRIAWQNDGDGKKVNAAKWMATGPRIPIQLSVASAKAAPPALRYETTRTSTFGQYYAPFLRAESPLIGGGWVQNEALEFAATPLFGGFSIRAGAGGGTSESGNSRTLRMQMLAANIDFTRSRAMHAVDASQPAAITLGLNFPAHHVGKLHVLWGSYTANSNGGAVLEITDKTSGEVLDAAKHPAMTYTTGYNVESEGRETIIAVGGKRELQIEVQDNFFLRRAFLQGVWLETASQPEYSVGEPISLAAFAMPSGAALSGVTFWINDQKIGTAIKAPYVFSWKSSKPGAYRVTARVTDVLGASGATDSTSIKIIAVQP